MLRSTFIVFITGWVAWFALDKPRPGPAPLPRASDQLLDNFQLAFDMLQAGEWEYAFIFIWHAHYWRCYSAVFRNTSGAGAGC